MVDSEKEEAALTLMSLHRHATVNPPLTHEKPSKYNEGARKMKKLSNLEMEESAPHTKKPHTKKRKHESCEQRIEDLICAVTKWDDKWLQHFRELQVSVL